MAKVILGAVIGCVLSFAPSAIAQFGSREFDERAKNWRERQHERRQDPQRDPYPSFRKPC